MVHAPNACQDWVSHRHRLLNVRLAHQGEGWWETVNARQQMANLRHIAGLKPERRQQFAESRKLEAQMLEAYNQGAYTNSPRFFRCFSSLAARRRGRRRWRCLAGRRW